MAGKNDIYKYGKKTQFSSENQPNNSGRKPKLYTIAKKAYNVSREEWNEVKYSSTVHAVGNRQDN